MLKTFRECRMSNRGTQTVTLLLTMGIGFVACANPRPTAPSNASGFVSSVDGTKLRYSINWPAGNGPFPAVVLVHGSGRVTRGDQQFLSDQFTAHGWAVLNYDKRGVGESEGLYSGVGALNSDTLIPLLASDAAAALQLLAGLSNVDKSRLGFAGGSQAGWIIPVAMTKAPLANVAVVLSGPTVTVGMELFYSKLAEQSQTSLDDVYAQLPAYDGVDGFDPLPFLQRVTKSMYWVYGDLDRSIPVRRCLTIHDRLRQEQQAPFTVVRYESLDHALNGNIWPGIFAFLDGVGLASTP